jgi:uncharacterized protein (TIGR03435 family)
VVLMRLGYHRDETFRPMVQTMLADQFKLVFHPDQKTLSVFALELAKGGASLQTSVEPGKPECSRSVGVGLVAEATCKSEYTRASLEKRKEAVKTLEKAVGVM